MKLIFLKISLIILFIANSPILHSEEKQAVTLMQVENLLLGYEWTLEPQKFLALGPNAETHLISISQDQKRVNYYRSRAIIALRLFQSDTAFNSLRNTALKSEPYFAKKAISSLSFAYIKTRKKEVQAIANKTLKKENANLRIKAAKILIDINDEASLKKVTDFLNSEKDQKVLKKVTTYKKSKNK